MEPTQDPGGAGEGGGSSMILERFYSKPLAHASYLVGCAQTGEAIVIDPGQDLDPYLAFAVQEGLRITAVTETHIHADYLSGSRALAERTGSRLYLTDEGPADWKYAFADQPNVTLIRHCDQIRIGNLRLDVWHTPGHTPEHVSFILTDEPASIDPVAAFTGDFIFIGDVGRPDLLERAAGFAGTMESGAKTLYSSLQGFMKAMPENLLIYPAHGAGSACGKSLGGVPASVLGYEKKVNWGLKVADESTFVDEVLAGQPEPPRYFAEMKARNKLGLRSASIDQRPHRLSVPPVGAVLLDTRPAGDFGLGFLPGSINVPFCKSFLAYAGAVLPYDKPLVIIAIDESIAAEVNRQLGLIGIDRVLGWVSPESLEGQVLATLEELSFDELETARSDGAFILDVRGRTEIELGQYSGSNNVPLPEIVRRVDELPRDRQIVVFCRAGSRSTVAASTLKSLGFANVVNFPGGYEEIQRRQDSRDAVVARG